MKPSITFMSLAVLLLGYNILFFICSGFENSLSVWISYGFINIAIILPFLISAMKWERTDIKTSAVTIAGVYTAIELIAGIILILVDPANFKWSLIINSILFIIPAFLLLLICAASCRK